MKILFKKINSDAKIPQFAQPGDAGMDLFSVEDLSLKPGERAGIKTGIALEIPLGYVGLIWDKSGVASKSGIKTAGGVIDSGYRGEIVVLLVNLSKDDYNIKKGQKVAQLLIQKVENPEILEADALTETARGEGGFGSTGIE
jgi:dUTP pyrophosphatase